MYLCASCIVCVRAAVCKYGYTAALLVLGWAAFTVLYCTILYYVTM